MNDKEKIRKEIKSIKNSSRGQHKKIKEVLNLIVDILEPTYPVKYKGADPGKETIEKP